MSDQTDTNDLRERVGQAVEKDGFISAWAQHFGEIVQAYVSGQSPENLLGEWLYSWMLKDAELREHFGGLASEAKNKIDEFLQGEAKRLPKWESRIHSDVAQAVRDLAGKEAQGCEGITEGDGSPMKCLLGEAFQNWGRTVKNTPYLTCFPKTITGVCNVVKWAAANNKTVRVAGYRHTWGDLYSADSQVLISMLPLEVVDQLPALEPPIDPTNELQGIKVVGTVEEGGTVKALCKIGAATTNEQFRRWCLDPSGGNLQWTVPLNVIMVEITWGGSNGPICHGAGWRHQTLSDLVSEIEFVNAKGEVQTVSDPDLLKSAAGCFGLLGVVTAVTLKLDPMTYAAMTPEKKRVALTIPPPQGLTVPPQIDMSGITEQDLEAAWADFVNRCETAYYSEWFWFPYQQDCWINTWSNDGDPANSVDYPGELGTIIEMAEEYVAQLLNNSAVFQALPGKWQAELLAVSAMYFLPPCQLPEELCKAFAITPAQQMPIVTPVIDALHFRRGIQNMRVLDMELEIPIPALADDPTKPDWSVCQKAWWAVLTNIYGRTDPYDAPMRITLEMRIMADSGVTMAPQFGNQFGTCALEVLTNLNVTQEEWLAFMQEMADAWDSYTDAGGNRLNVRPHWAKQWQGLKFRGTDVVQYLKEVAYKDRLPEFGSRLQAIAQAGGYTLADIQRMFSNPLLDNIFGSIFAQ